MAVHELLSERSRNAGTVLTSIIDVPPGLRSFEARGIMEDATVLDNTLVMTWRVLATFDGNEWTDLMAGGWAGGIDEMGNSVGRPNQTWATSGPLPIQLQGEVTSNKRARWGLEVEIA